MMRIRMLCDHRVAFDGFTVEHLRAGEVYELDDDRAEHLLRRGVAEQDKMLGAADAVPETKIDDDPPPPAPAAGRRGVGGDAAPYASLGLAELRALAAERGLKVRASARRAELQKLLADDDASR